MVLAASGVEHEELLAYAEPLLSDLPSGSSPMLLKSVYTGGDFRCQGDLGVCITIQKNLSTILYPSRLTLIFSFRTKKPTLLLHLD